MSVAITVGVERAEVPFVITRSIHAGERQRQKARLDSIFRRKVKARDGFKCRLCGSGTQVDCAHFFTRKRSGTRWDMDAAWTLCRSHHDYYTKRPRAWEALLETVLGVERFEELRAKSLTIAKVDLDEIRVALEAA